MRKLIFVSLFVLGNVFAFTEIAQAHKELCRGFLPENNIRIPVSATFRGQATGLTHKQFDALLDRLQAEYSPDFERVGAKFQIDRRWTDTTLNAYAFQANENWYIAMYGGLARHPAMTEDGFLAVACHETGHHLGGAPKFKEDPWGSVEGQADYFATLKCMRRMFLKDDNAKILAKKKLDPIAVAGCREQHVNDQDRLICIRSAMAGASLASVLSVMSKDEKKPELATPDQSRVLITDEDHPRSQCRMDTYLQGALCKVPFVAALDNADYRVGTCGDEAVYSAGLRPGCWFAK